MCENALLGNLPSEWDLANDPANPNSRLSDPAIQGFASSISVNKGETVAFKVNTTGIASTFTIDIYRLGYYGGRGARKVAQITPSAEDVTNANNQPGCVADGTGLVDCGNWSVTGAWPVPTDATSGIYIGKLTRADTGGASHLVFIVRDDARPADVLFQTSDTTWQAYNRYGGKSLYYDAASSPTSNNINPPEYQALSAGRAYKVSYNRPFETRDHDPQSWLFNAEYPMVRFLEANGYDVKYWSGVDTDRFGPALVADPRPKAFLSVGHDEYWSAGQRSSVEAARNAGVSLAFFSGNEMFWKTRWEPSLAGEPYKTLVSYKETFHTAVPASALDPNPTVWTGTWRDPNGASLGASDGGRPENAVTGTLFTVNSGTTAIQVPAEYGHFRLWRDTNIASFPPGTLVSLAPDTLGYEWDEDIDNGQRPSGLARLSLTTVDGTETLVDSGATFVRNTNATHALTMYRHPTNGALVFGAGTVQWSWGLDGNHDRRRDPAVDPNLTIDARMRQATVNLFADMGVAPGLLQPGLISATGSSDSTPPTSAIADPLAGANLQAGVRVSISGTAIDANGGVAAVEVSVDGGTTWHRARGLASWSYDWSPTTSGAVSLRSRAIDDSGNIETPGAGVTVNVIGSVCPCQSLWNPATTTPDVVDSGDGAAVEVGVKFSSDTGGFVTGLRFYKSAANTGPHVGSLWTSGGTLLASAAFSNEGASGWQEVQFASPVHIDANTTFVASYHANVGHYAASHDYFGTTGIDSPPLHAPAGATGVFTYASTSAFPTSSFRSSNYWVDVIFSASGQIPPTQNLTPPTISSVRAAALDQATAVIRWVTNQPSTSQVQYSTDPNLPSDATSSSTIDTNLVTSHAVVLSGLTANATYYYRVLSANRAGIVGTFASAPSVTVPGPTLHDTAAVDFTNGTTGSSTYVSQTGDGEVILKPAEGAEFFGSALPPGWKGIAWASGGSAIVGGGNLVVDGMRVGTCATDATTGICSESSPYGPGRSLEFVATFAGDAFQHAGFAVDLDRTARWAIFSTGGGGTLLARTDPGIVETVTDLGPSYLDGRPHRYRIDWHADSVAYFIDGAGVATHAVAIADGMRPIAASDFSLLPGKVVVDWIRMAPYAAAGDFVSRVFDATIDNEVWNSIVWTASTSGVSVSVRASNTPFTDADPNDPAWRPVAAPGALTGVAGRYIQYMAHLSGANANQTPELDDLVVSTDRTPVAVPDRASTPTGVPYVFPASGAFSLKANDTDDDNTNDQLYVSAVTAPAHGLVDLNDDGSVTYAPAPDFSGKDTFTYTITDGLLTSTATVTVTVGNRPPAASDDSVATNEDTALTVAAPGVLGNDTDPDVGDTRTAVLVAASGPANGSLTFNTDGSFTYTPSLNFNGTDSFTYQAKDAAGALSNVATVTITVKAVNDAPVAANDAYTTNEDTPLTIAAPGVLGNDTDVDLNDTRTAVLVAASGPANGSLILNADGSLRYTPNANFNGTDSFTYQAKDAAGALSNVATVTITVNAVNDAPVASGQSITTAEDTAKSITLTATDVDGNALRYIVVTGPAHGTLTGSPPALTYTPAANYNGADSFTFKANDGTADSNTATVSISVTPVNDAPIAARDSYGVSQGTTLTVAAPGVLGNDSDVDSNSLTAILVTTAAKGTLTLNANGGFTYTPQAGASGTDSFTYKANDGFLDSAPVTVMITIAAPPAPPPAPTVGAISWNVPVQPVNVATAVTATASAANAQSATWNWGDGTTSAGTISGTSVIGTRAYAATGLYTVTLTVMGANNTSVSTAYQYVVVIDPLGKSETGLGSFTSPAGSFVGNPALSGLATINALTAKYGTDGTLTTVGNTNAFRFTYSAAFLSFTGTKMSWLVVNGNKSWLKGEGNVTIAGTTQAADYLVAVVDASASPAIDKVRVRIVSKTTGKVLYDTQNGAVDSADAAAPTPTFGTVALK